MAEDTVQIHKRQKRRKMLIITGIVVLVVAAAGAGVGLRWWQTQQRADDEAIPTPTLSAPATELQDLRSEGDQEMFNEKVAQILADPNLDNETRYQVLLQQGHNFVDKQEWQGAIEAYMEAENLQETYEVVQLLAETYRQSGDNAKAIEYYKKAVELIPQDSPIADADRAWLEDNIRTLEEQQ
jgi:tetratricopeptide (TPR) repeat protein